MRDEYYLERREAETRPAMYVGSSSEGRLHPILQALCLGALTPVFARPASAKVLLQEARAMICVQSDGLSPSLWASDPTPDASDLRQWLHVVGPLATRALLADDVVERTHLRLSLSAITGPTVLASRAIVGVRWGGSTFWQEYDANVPRRPVAAAVFATGDPRARVGLWLGLDFDDTVVAGSEYTAGAVWSYVAAHFALFGSAVPFDLQVELGGVSSVYGWFDAPIVS